MGLRRRDDNQLATIQFAPAAYVSVSQLQKIDRAVMIAVPIAYDPCLPAVDLNERSRPNYWKHRVIFLPDIPIKRVSQVHLLTLSLEQLQPSITRIDFRRFWKAKTSLSIRYRNCQKFSTAVPRPTFYLTISTTISEPEGSARASTSSLA